MTGVVIVFLYLIAVSAAGMGVALIVFRGAGRVAAEVWLPVSFALGLGLQAMVLLSAMVAFGAGPVWLAGVAGLVALGAGIALQIKGDPARRVDLGGFQMFANPPADGNQRALHFAAFALIAFFVVVVYLNALSYPFTSYDGRAIWSYKAKVMLHEQSILGEAFTDPYRIHYHRDYPVLVPIAMYAIYDLTGGVNERLVRMLFSTFFLMQVLFLYGMLRRIGTGGALAMVGALFYCATPFRDDWSERDGGALNSGAVDIPLSFFAMVSVLGFLLFWRERQRWQYLLGGVFGGLALMTKSEGVVIVAVALAGNMAVALFGRGGAIKRDVALAIGGVLLSFAVALPWQIAKSGIPNFYDEDYGAQFRPDILLGAWQRLGVILYTIGKEIVFIEKWNWYWVALIAMVPAAIPAWLGRREFFLDSLLLAWLSIYLFVYMVSPLNLVFHLNTSTSRLASHLLPLVLVRLILFWAARNPFDTPARLAVLRGGAAPC